MSELSTAVAAPPAAPAPPDLLEFSVVSDPTVHEVPLTPPESVVDDPEAEAARAAVTARAAMVARLEDSGDLSPGPVREALLALPREVLMPQAYVRRSAPDETPPHWDLLDWSQPADRNELLRRLYSGTAS